MSPAKNAGFIIYITARNNFSLDGQNDYIQYHKQIDLNLLSILTGIILGLFVTSCNSHSSETGKETKSKSTISTKLDIRKKPGSSFRDSLVVKRASAIFFQPDSIQLEKIKAVNEAMVFESLTHDCYYQMRNAKIVIEKNWPSIQIIDASKVRWLVFKKENASSIIDLDSINNICGIYLFNGVKDPVRIDMTNIDTELNFYFKNN
jgi:hypothetical protein